MLYIVGNNKTVFYSTEIKQKGICYMYENGPTEINSSQANFNHKITQWSTSDNICFFPVSPSIPEIPPGVYEIKYSNSGLFFEKIPIRSENLIHFPDSNSTIVYNEIKKFWDREDVFKQYNLIHKRGILLYGPPGSGKSCLLQLIMKDVVERQGIVVKVGSPNAFIDGMRTLRKIQPNIPVVATLEDIDSIIDNFGESELLNILDGMNEIYKTVFLATTNHPEKLGERIINRPSRFDKKFNINHPDSVCRQLYLEHLCKDDLEKLFKQPLNQILKDTDGFSLAHLKELFIAVVILDNDYYSSVDILQNMKIIERDNDFGFARKVCRRS